MRQISIALLLLCACFCSASPADTAVPPRTVSVSGSMATQVAPDIVRWSLTQSENDVNLAAAKERSDMKMKALLCVVRELGVAPEDTQTGALRVERTYVDTPRRDHEFKDWLVQRTISLKQRDIARFDEYFAKLLGASELEVSYSFESSKYHELRADTRLKAVKLAREKAEAMCAALGVRCGAPMTITESSPQHYMPSSTPWHHANALSSASNGSVAVSFGPPDNAAGTFASGQIEIQETVSITFKIE